MDSLREPSHGRSPSPSIVVLTRLAIDPASDRDLRQLEPGENPRFLEDAWLSERVHQMVNLSLRSLESQSRSPELHLIAVDERVLAKTVKLLSGRLPAFSEILEIGLGQTFNGRVRDRLRSLGPDIVTVRLDSDDCLARSFLELVSDRAEVGQALNFPHGIQWIASRRYVVHRFILSNPTIAYRSDNGTHVFDFGRHRLVRRLVPTVNKWTVSPMYLKYSHPLSHATYQTGGWSLIFPGRALRNFGVEESAMGELAGWTFRSLGDFVLFHFRRRFRMLDSFLYKLVRRWKRSSATTESDGLDRMPWRRELG